MQSVHAWKEGRKEGSIEAGRQAGRRTVLFLVTVQQHSLERRDALLLSTAISCPVLLLLLVVFVVIDAVGMHT